MKRITFLVFAIFMTIATYAQQSLWGGGDITSPEINADNSVTFRLFAPEAQKVEITGDFLPTQKMDTQMGEIDVPGKVSLSKDEKGIWSYTTPEPLASELYSYSLVIDGVSVTDPNNSYMIRDVASVTSIFIIGGGHADL